MKPRSWRLAGIAAGLTLLFCAAPAGAQQVTGSAVLHRDTIVEGQTRAFQISGIPTRPEYYLHASVGGAFTAEAGDVTVATDNLLGQAQTVTPDSNGPRAYPDRIYNNIRFEVTANPDSDGTGDETFGVRLCTTTDCTGGTVLGEWTVTVTEPAADTNVSGATGATVTIPGGSRLTMMESSANDDSRDRQATLRVTLAASPTADLVLVARTGATVATGPDEEGNPTTRPIARGVGATSSDSIAANEDNYDPASADFEVARWDSGTTSLTKEARFLANDNIVDAAGGAHIGNFSFRLLIRDSNYTDNFAGNGTVYSGVTIPDVPYSVIDDEPTRVRVLPLGTPDNEATEGSATDTAKFRVRIDRALAGSEELKVPLRFTGATLGTEFTIALDGSPSGASLNATTGVLTFSGAGAREATVVVTAASDDGNTVAESLRVNIPQYSDPWHERHFGTNLAGGACSGVACPNYDSGEGGQRGYRMTLVEAGPGLVIIDTGDSRIEEGDFYEYWVRLNAAPAAAVTVAISTSPADKVSFSGTRTLPDPTRSLTFTTGNWMSPQRVRLVGRGASNFDTDDDPDLTITLTHEISSSDSAYNALADVTHTLRYLDDDPTEVSLLGAGVRASPSGNQISKVMLEGDATRVDRSLTVTLSRALVEGEVARIPLILHAEGHSTADGECDTSGAGVPSSRMEHCAIVEGLRGPRISANVAWPLHHNDFVMAATGTGVRIEGVNRYTPNYRGYRILEFRGAGAQTATFALHARDGFNDGDTFDEEISIRPLTRDEIAALFGTRFHAGIDTEPDTPGAAAWFGIDDDEPPELAEGELVPAEWSQIPSGLTPGDEFRLIYVTSQTTTAVSSDLSTYDAFVRAEITGNNLVNGGVAAMREYASHFKAVGGNSSTTARDHARFDPGNGDHPNVSIYWVGGSRVAGSNGGFVDGAWDDEANPRTADGVMVSPNAAGYWTGSARHGHTGSARCRSAKHPLGAGTVWLGFLNDDTPAGQFGIGSRHPLGPVPTSSGVNEAGVCRDRPANSEMRPMYALSGVFVVDAVAGAAIGNASAAEGGAVAFTVTIPEAAPAGGITVPYTLSDGRGVSSDPAYIVADSNDYADAASGSIMIAQGATTGVITVNTTQDSTYESDHYFTVTLGTPTGTDAPPVDSRNGSAIGIVEDDADLPTVQFDPASVNANEADGTATLTVTRTGTTLVPSSVTWTTADGTGAGGATHPGDYTSATGTVAFGATESSKTITIDITADSTAESAERFSVQLSQPVDATLGGDAAATITLNDDPKTVPTVQFQNAAMVIYESLPFEFPYIAGAVLQSSSAVAADTVVSFTVGGTATPPGVSEPDFVIIDATSDTSETILAGETEADFNVRMFNDDFHEPDETVILTLVDGEDYDLGEQTTFTVTIRDLPDVRFAEAASTGLEGETVEVVVEATHDFTAAASVRLQIVGTATRGEDYDLPDATVRFGVGERRATVSIPVTADLVEETGETIVLNLPEGDGYDLDPGGPRQHTVTLEDNEALLPLTVKFAASGSSVVEGGTATVTVEASRPVGEDTDVAFTVSPPSQNGATADTDYTTPASPVTIASGETTATIGIPITDDGKGDDFEKILLTLTDGEDYDLADANTRHTVTLFEEELATINLTRPRLHLTEGGPSVRYGVSLTRNPAANVDVYVTSPDIGLFTVAGADGVRYQQIKLRFTRRNWDTPQLVTVQAVQDDNKDSEQNLFIDHAIRGTQANSANFEFGSPYFSHNRGGTGDDSSDDIGVALPDLPVYIADDDASPGDGGLTLEYLDADAARPIVIEEGKATTLRLRWSRALTTGETAAARLTIAGGAHGDDKDYQLTTDTPNVTVEALPVGAAKTEFIVTWAKAATNATAAIRIKSRNDGKRATGERTLLVELLDAFSSDGSAGKDDTPSGVRLKNGPQEERIHVLSRDRLVVQQTTPDGFVFNGLETTGDDAELTTDNAWAEIGEDGSATHKVRLSLSRPPTNTGDVVVTVSTSDADKLSVAGSSDGDGVADTVTWVSSGSGAQYRDPVTVEFTAEEDGDSDSEAVFVYFTMTSGYGNAHPPGTLARAFRVDIKDDDGGVIIVPTSLTLREGANRGEIIPGSDPARRAHQIAVRLNTDPGDGSVVVLTPSVYDVKNTNLLSTKVDPDKRRLRFTGGETGNWNEYQLIGFSAKADSDSDNDEFFLRWSVTGYTGVGSVDIPAVTISVLDSDPAVRISESEFDLVEGASAGSGGARTYDVVLNAPPADGEIVIVTPTSSDSGAVSFDAGSALATPGRPPRFGVSNWDRPQRVTVHAAADGDENDETATITHIVSGGNNYGSVAAPAITVNVLDDDMPEGIVLSTNSVRVEEGGHPVSFTVRLAGRPSGPVSLNVTGAGSAVSADADLSTDGAQTTLAFTQQDWHRPNTVWLSAEDESDATDSDDEFVTLMVGGAGASYAALPVAVTVLDDEFSGPTFTVSGSGTLTEGTVGSAIFTVSADISPTGALPVTLNISETADFVAAGDEGDQTLGFSSLLAIINHSVPIDDDSVAEDDGSITATLKPGSGYRVGTPSSATINVVDDPNDTTVGGAGVDVTLSASDGDADGNAVEGASGATGYRTVTLTLSRALTGAETVTVPLTAQGATVTADYAFGLQPATQNGVTLLTSNPHSAQNPAVQFAAGAATATLRFTPVNNDARSQPAVSIGLGTPTASGATVGDVTGGPIVLSIVDDESGVIEVPGSWALAPAGLGGGEKFRLIFVTSETRTAESADIDDYNTWVQGVVARGGHANLLPYGGLVTAIGSTAAVDARENTGMWDPSLNSGSGGWADGSTSDADSGTKIHWLAAPPRHKVADNYHEFHGSNGWDGGLDQSGRDTTEAGASRTSGTGIWTGTTTDGTDDGDTLGSPGNVNVGVSNSSLVNPLYEGLAGPRADSRPMFGISPVFEVEAPELSFDSGGAFRVAEGETATVTVTSNIAAPVAATVSYTVIGGSATGGTDYAAPSGTFALTAGATSHALTIDTTEDTLVEGNEDIAIRLDAGTGYTVGSPDTATVTITDDDTPAATPVLAFAPAAYSVDEDGGTVSVTVDAAPAPGNALTVNLSSASVTAGLRDYVKPAATFVFPASQTSHTFSVTIRDDDLHEDDETFTLTLDAASDASYTLGSPATATVTITSDDPRPPPVVSVHPKDAVGVEGANNSASVELRLSRALESGETLTVPYSLDLNAGANESDDGVTLTHAPGDPSTGALTIAGPNAPQGITLRLSPAANSVDSSVSGVRAAEFKLTGVSGVAGAEAVAGADSAKVFVNDGSAGRSTYMNVSGGSTNATTTRVVNGATTVRLDGSIVDEGGKVLVLLDGKAGWKRNAGRPYDPHNVTVGVQHLTTDFDDLGAAYAGHDAFVGRPRRDESAKTDYYNVGVLGMGFSAEMWIPVNADAAGEGDERFRVFIAGTPGYMGVEGAYNATDDRAPGVDFTIRGQPGGGQRDEQPRPEPPPAPTEAVSNVRVAAVDANNARATWDAVEHATGYEVAWDALDGDGQSIAAGLDLGVAGTSETIAHNAPGAASLEVTVTPQYVDGNGDTQTLAGLAGTATINLGSTGNGDSVGDGGTGGGDSGTGDPTPASSCVGDAQWGTVEGYYKSNAGKAPKYGSNWYRVLIAYRLEDADRALPAWTGATERPTAAYTVKEAEDGEKVWGGWTPVRKVLECLRDAKLISRSFVPLVPAASNPAREGVVRIANRSARAGAVRIAATDDAGWRPEPLQLQLGAGQSIDLTSADLERGNAAKGLRAGTGPGMGDWRLDVSSGLDLGVRPFVRAADGASAAMHGLAEAADGIHEVWTFNPADGLQQTSLLRVMNLGAEPVAARITGIDDAGVPGGAVTLEVPARAAATFTAAELERGGSGLEGALGDGHGRWRLRVASAGELAVMNLAVSPFGHLTNLSGGGFPALRDGRAHPVPHFPPASDGLGRLGLVRVVNESARGGEVHVLAHDAAGRRHGPLTLRLGPGGAAQFDSWDLEFGGEAGGGLSGGTGPGVGPWRLEVTSGLDIVVRAYVATPAGSLKTAREFVAGPGPLRWGEAFAEDR